MLVALGAAILTERAQLESRERERRLDTWRAVNFRKLDSKPGAIHTSDQINTAGTRLRTRRDHKLHAGLIRDG